MLPNAELTYREGLPNLYCGMFVVILLVFYWISRTIPLREKLLNGAFLVFLIFSLNINKLDFIWHGFHFPNQLPYRYTFMICFLLIAMAYQVFQRVDEMIRDGEFANLKGLIYFTDGYGLFPERMPAYKTAFVFVEDGCEIPEVPVWAMKLVLTREEVEEMAESTNK